MFDVTANDIAQLNDIDLRELVGRLCEAELASRGLPVSAVTWGGNQTATDGGLDVRVALPSGEAVAGFIPRASTGFQVKTPDMPRAEILGEMRPSGVIRPVISSLVDDAGAYIIVSSHGSTADSALLNRQNAMREALNGVPNAHKLATDFYDRTRVATWVRQHAGLIAWVREKVGRSLVGWRPYGAWSGPSEGTEAEYIIDEKLRLHFGSESETTAQPVAEALDLLRDRLSKPGKVIRLVGLSGVGKTRLVQAMFDSRIGSRSLPPSYAVYTNMSDNPDPQPIGLASDLIATRKRAVLIVDNCPPELHRRLSDLCAADGSAISVLTVEYDVKDDQPEGTEVVTLDTSSPELIEKLVARRYPRLSQVDARTIADISGGNARIAIAIAGTVGPSDTIAGLSDEELFGRLFHQRQPADAGLLLAAQALSLLYSFEGENLTGTEAELPHLAALIEQSPQQLYRHAGELVRRELVQKRSIWRAVLPHAVANRLAGRALQDIPFSFIEEKLVTGGTDRLARSFSRRLSYLHDEPRAATIVSRWLAPDGLLGSVAALNELGRAMFENVAPVCPEAALSALERVDGENADAMQHVLYRHRWLLRSLAYEPTMFERSAVLLLRGATIGDDQRKAKELRDIFTSFFQIYLSGTHATIEQRLNVVEKLLQSDQETEQSIGFATLDAVLEAWHFSSSHSFNFGARPRDYGYAPKANADVIHWYNSALNLIEKLAIGEKLPKPELRRILAQNLRDLWTKAGRYDGVEKLALLFAADEFWRDGWAACRQALHFDRESLASEVSDRLRVLADKLKPTNVFEQVQASVLGERSGALDVDDLEVGDGDAADFARAYARMDEAAIHLGELVAGDDPLFLRLAPLLARGGVRVWMFARGLARATADIDGTWHRLVEALRALPIEQRDVQVLRGFLAELWERDREVAQRFLDAALCDADLVPFIPVLHSALRIDSRGVQRLKRALDAPQVRIGMFSNLSLGRCVDDLDGQDLADLLRLISEKEGGLEIAIEILQMRFFSERSSGSPHDANLLTVGREFLDRSALGKGSDLADYRRKEILSVCLAGPEGSEVAASMARRLRSSAANYEAYAFSNQQLLCGLLEVQPLAVLDALFEGNPEDYRTGLDVFDHIDRPQSGPADKVPVTTLIAWCDTDPVNRYPLAAAFISFARSSEEKQTRVWTDQAKALLENAPDKAAVLKELVRRFMPISFSGSRATLIEANAALLDCLPIEVTPAILPVVVQAKAQLDQVAQAERRQETQRDRERDERFE